MKLIIYVSIFCAVSLMFGTTSFSQRRSVPTVSIEGSYEHLTVGKPSGDLEGMRVILIDGGGSIYAIVQEAAGGVELPEPVLAKVKVSGKDISFSVRLPGGDAEQLFSGRVSAAGLTLQKGPARPQFVGANGERPMFLKRKKC